MWILILVLMWILILILYCLWFYCANKLGNEFDGKLEVKKLLEIWEVDDDHRDQD